MANLMRIGGNLARNTGTLGTKDLAKCPDACDGTLTISGSGTAYDIWANVLNNDGTITFEKICDAGTCPAITGDYDCDLQPYQDDIYSALICAVGGVSYYYLVRLIWLVPTEFIVESGLGNPAFPDPPFAFLPVQRRTLAISYPGGVPQIDSDSTSYIGPSGSSTVNYCNVSGYGISIA